MNLEKHAEEYADRVVGFLNEKQSEWEAARDHIVAFCNESKWMKIQLLTARIEENESILEMLRLHGSDSSVMRVYLRVEELKEELNKLNG